MLCTVSKLIDDHTVAALHWNKANFMVENYVNHSWCSAHLYHAGCNDYNQHHVGSHESPWHCYYWLATIAQLPHRWDMGLPFPFLIVTLRLLSAHDIPSPEHLFWSEPQALILGLLRQGVWTLLEVLSPHWIWMPTLPRLLKQHYCQADQLTET